MSENINKIFYTELRKKLTYQNNEKQNIARDMLERYTGSKIEDFQKYILLTNFNKYLDVFAERYNEKMLTGSMWSVIHSESCKVTMIDFKMGAPTAALVIELLSVLDPQAVLFLGMCGGLHSSLQVGDFILPMAAIRDEGVSHHFIPPQVPSLPTFKIQKFVSQMLVEAGLDYRTGVVHTSGYRFWEFDDAFIRTLYEERAIAIEMECAALFSVGFVSKTPIGALLLVSDLPLQKGGIKTKESANTVFSSFTERHINLGIKAITEIQAKGEHIRHYRW